MHFERNIIMKKYLLVLLALALMLSMTACGKSEAAQAADDLIAAIGTVTLDSAAAIEAAEDAVAALRDKEKDTLEVEFHYCPLLKAWQKMGYDDEKLAKLCDIAMDGDRGIAAGLGCTIDITDTLAKGCPTCKIAYHKK